MTIQDDMDGCSPSWYQYVVDYEEIRKILKGYRKKETMDGRLDGIFRRIGFVMYRLGRLRAGGGRGSCG
ncbi:MAG: hypothetical protein GDA39_08880 [Hyphomonadaceae bacterium]|nr:hypothetical protein [Hyphomonadaceae bacterium]MBC6412962.1 hypothetical protein [Hyphomonadaceae bacterium]